MLRMNKYPFFLWLTQARDDLKVDLQNQKVISEELGESPLKKVHIVWIFLMKYFPLLLLASFFFVPRNLIEVGVFFIGAIFVALFLYLLKYPFVLKIIIIIFCIVNLYLIFNFDNYVNYLSSGLTFFMEILCVAVVLYDIFVTKGYKNWYYLSSFKREVTIKFSERKERKIFFFKKKTGRNITKNYTIKGYFLRITNETDN